MSDSDVELHSNSRVPLAWLFSIIGAAFTLATGLIFVGMWAGTTDTKANTALAKVDKLESALSGIAENTGEINTRLSRIEGALGVAPSKNEK